jgi:rhamnosyltransferase
LKRERSEKPRLNEDVEISVVIPTRDGGALLRRVVDVVLSQRTPRRFELIVVDSGSAPAEVAAIEKAGAIVRSIEPGAFDHGLTRDLGASLARGRAIVFLNQDVLPVGTGWLDGLTAPIFADPPADAVQGAIAEMPEAELSANNLSRFFWGTGGPRFYFTRESERWIVRHGGIGFSTVHCAIRRDAWLRLPFGSAPILEDKKWQAAALASGFRVVAVGEHEALVWHSHQYGLRSLWRRCASEGFGWRRVGVDYSAMAALSDVVRAPIWREWRSAIASRVPLTPAELLFPVLRPVALWWGNHCSRSVLH